MPFAINSSVGAWEKGAVNLKADVITVQQMLTQASQKHGKPEWDPKGIDGTIAKPPSKSATVDAIKAFQKSFTATPDGLIGVNMTTWKKLVAAVGEPSQTPGTECFPFEKLPNFDWVSGARKFASNRSNGTRAHAGCDLYFPLGTIIHAVADGVVTLGPYPFYAETFAIEVDHGTFLARYGEVQKTAFVAKGDVVKAGQKIAKVGHLVGIVVPSDMLHLELYGKTLTGPLTVSAANSKLRSDGVPFLRRKDLLDPTPFLNKWKANLPKP